MLANIISHNRKHDSTTTLKFGDETLEKNVQLDLVDIEDATLLSDVTVYDYISKIKTPFLMGYPAIVSPKDGDLITDASVFELTPYTPNENFKGVVNKVEWQIASDKDFTNIVWKTKLREADVPNGDFSKFRPTNVFLPSGYYYVRARYISYPHSSPFTQPVRVNFPSFKVSVPTLSYTANELHPIVQATAYTLSPEFKGKEADDPLVRVTWGITEVEDGSTVNSEKINALLSSDYQPQYTVVKVDSDDDKYFLKFPETDSITKSKIELKPNTTYLVTCTFKGVRYSTPLSRLIFKTGNFRVKPPKFKLTSAENGVVSVNFDPIETYEGSDTLDYFDITVINQSSIPQQVVHTAMVNAFTYRVPDDVLEPSNKYSFSISAVGKKYGVSDTSILSISMPYVGIEPPKLSITTKGMQPTAKLSPFKAIKTNDTQRGTQWLLYNHANTGVNNLIKEWIVENNDSFLIIDRKWVEVNTNYKLKARYLGHKYNSPWVEEVFKTINIVVKKPVVTLSNNGLVITGSVSDYVVVGDEDTPEYVVWNVYEVDITPSSDPNVPPTETVVTHLIQDRTLKWDSRILKIDRNDGIKRNTTYKVTAKILGKNYNSLVSDPAYLTTPNVYIITPEIHISGEPDQVPRFPIITGSEFKTNMDSDIHVKTTWKIVATGTGEVVYNEDDRVNKTTLNILDPILLPNTEYKLTVIYHGEAYGPTEPVSITFRTRLKFIEMPDDGLPNVQVGDDNSNETSKYYGTIPIDQLNDTRNYLGVWNGYTEYGVDSQVVYENRLWRALDTSSYAALGNNVHLNKNRIPGKANDNNIIYWEEDDRNNLSTYRWLLRNIGFHATITDNNKTGLTSNLVTKGTYEGSLTSTVSKFMVGMKVMYLYDTPELKQISYNDLAIYGLTGKGRTIRVGERLYWLRLPTIEEIKELQRFKATEDTTNLIPSDLNTECWLANGDDPESGAYNQANQIVSYEPATNRTKALRLILEYVSPYEEPWLRARKEYGELQYDRYTDTGYFGIVPNNVDEFNIYNAIGLTKGTRINLDFGFLAFWSHGKRILINRASISYGVEFKHLVDLGVVYGPDVKLSGYTNKSTNQLGDNKTYHIRIPRGGPSFMDLGPIEDLPNDRLIANANLFRFSEWNELIYRVAEHIPLSIDINNYHGGFQIGRNWSNLDNINLGVFEHYSGNGCHDYVLTSVNNNEIISRGGTKLEAVYYVDKDHARNDHGVRLVLEDTTDYSVI